MRWAELVSASGATMPDVPAVSCELVDAAVRAICVTPSSSERIPGTTSFASAFVTGSAVRGAVEPKPVATVSTVRAIGSGTACRDRATRSEVVGSEGTAFAGTDCVG